MELALDFGLRTTALYLANPLYSLLASLGPFSEAAIQSGFAKVSHFVHGRETRSLNLTGIQNNLFWSGIICLVTYLTRRQQAQSKRTRYDLPINRATKAIELTVLGFCIMPAFLRLCGLRPVYELETSLDDLSSIQWGFRPLRVEHKFLW